MNTPASEIQEAINRLPESSPLPSGQHDVAELLSTLNEVILQMEIVCADCEEYRGWLLRATSEGEIADWQTAGPAGEPDRRRFRVLFHKVLPYLGRAERFLLPLFDDLDRAAVDWLRTEAVKQGVGILERLNDSAKAAIVVENDLPLVEHYATLMAHGKNLFAEEDRNVLFRPTPAGSHSRQYCRLGMLLELKARLRATAAGEEPVKPIVILRGWAAIAAAVGIEHTDAFRKWILEEHRKCRSPVVLGPGNTQPMAEERDFVVWFNGIVQRSRIVAEEAGRVRSEDERDAKATTEPTTPYGRRGVVAHEIKGEVKERKKA